MRIRVHINFSGYTGNALDTTEFPEVVRISALEMFTEKNAPGNKGFQLSPSKDVILSPLDGTHKFYPSEGYRGVLTRAYSASDCTFTTPPRLKFLARGQNLHSIYVTFDRACEEYARRLKVTVGSASEVFTNEQVSMQIPLSQLQTTGTDSLSISLEILEWSRPHACAKITQVSLEYNVVLTGSSLLSASWSEHTLNSQATVSPGLVEQFADISIYDRDNQIHKAHDNNLLRSNTAVVLEVVDDDDEIVDTFNYGAADWDVKNDSTIVNLSCRDLSNTFNKITVQSLSIATRTIHDFVSLLFSYAPSVAWRYDSSTTEQYCKGIKIPNSWLKERKLNELLNCVCSAALLRIYWSKSEFVVMRCW